MFPGIGNPPLLLTKYGNLALLTDLPNVIEPNPTPTVHNVETDGNDNDNTINGKVNRICCDIPFTMAGH